MAKKNFKELFDPRESKWGGISLPMALYHFSKYLLVLWEL